MNGHQERATWSQLHILSIIVEEHPRCCTPQFEQAEVEFAGLNFKVETGSRYLGSFIGEAKENESWIAHKVDDWVNRIKKLAGAARPYPQSASSALQRSVNQEWQ